MVGGCPCETKLIFNGPGSSTKSDRQTRLPAFPLTVTALPSCSNAAPFSWGTNSTPPAAILSRFCPALTDPGPEEQPLGRWWGWSLKSNQLGGGKSLSQFRWRKGGWGPIGDTITPHPTPTSILGTYLWHIPIQVPATAHHSDIHIQWCVD